MSDGELQYDHERKLFEKAFSRWLCVASSSCWERDVLRVCKPKLWEQWLAQVNDYKAATAQATE